MSIGAADHLGIRSGSFMNYYQGNVYSKTDSGQSTLTGVLAKDPDLSKVPQRYHRLLRACLNKDPQQRLVQASGIGACSGRH
jgi:hypothetical protein